eukprot:gene2171-2671_t
MNAKHDFQYNLNNNNNSIENIHQQQQKYYQIDNFSHWFGIQEYFLLLALRDRGPDISELSSLLSAFAIALHNTGCLIPAFVGFDEKRHENFLGYMRVPISKFHAGPEDPSFTVKFSTESIVRSTLTSNQNVSDSIEKQLRIFYSKLSVDPDDRNWEQFLALSTISTRYTFIKSHFDEFEWRFMDLDVNDPGLTGTGNKGASVPGGFNSNYEEEEDDDEYEDRTPRALDGNDLFRWGYPMDPIEELRLSVISPPISSVHVIDNSRASSSIQMMTPKSWFVKAVFRKPHHTLFQLSIGVSNVFNSLLDALKSNQKSVQDLLSDYNLSGRYSSGSQSNLQQQYYSDSNPSIMKTMGSITKSLASSINSPLIPTDRELDLILRDLFFDKKDPKHPKHFNNISEDLLNQPPLSNKMISIRRSPIDSLFFSFCFVCLNIQSLVGILLFWMEFIQEIKWHWEHSLPIPRIFNSSHINGNNTLIFQKLHMINYCISRKTSINTDSDSNNNSFVDQQNNNFNNNNFKIDNSSGITTEQKTNDWGLDDDLDLPLDDDEINFVDNTNKELVIPKTQEFGPMTDDMVSEHVEQLQQLGDSDEANEKRMEMQTPMLLSDMQSFKHANPGCVFEDFVRWHSARDWIPDSGKKEEVEEEEENYSHKEEFNMLSEDDESLGREKKKGFGRDGHLSDRMVTKDNLWRRTWSQAKPIPAHKQTPLFDHNLQAEKAIQYLENISPSDLLHQIMSVILSSIATIFSSEKSSNSSLSSEYCLGISHPHTKQLISNYIDSLNNLWSSHVPNEIKKNEYELIFKNLQEIENSISKLTSLKTKFKKLDRVISNLYKDGFSDILGDPESNLISDVFFRDYQEDIYNSNNNNNNNNSSRINSNEININNNHFSSLNIQPNIKEYITRSYAPRPFKNSQTMPHRMYTCISPHECRLATCISEED